MPPAVFAPSATLSNAQHLEILQRAPRTPLARRKAAVAVQSAARRLLDHAALARRVGVRLDESA